MIWKIIVFIISTAILIYISRASLREPPAHGFYRFFAWEFILLLFIVNVELWFVRPFAWHQVISWILLILSIVPLVWGIVLLRQVGKPVKQRAQDPNLLAFEKTSTLVTSGIYRYVRHPLYSSLLLLAWGIFFKAPSWTGGGLAAMTTLFLVLTARADEAECLRFFGPAYKAYMQKTHRFLPFVF